MYLTANEREVKVMRYAVMVGGVIANKFDTIEEAKAYLEEIRNSFLAMVHPQDTMFIKEIEIK
jgi:hypothetical protein